jgi:hypothetical protein
MCARVRKEVSGCVKVYQVCQATRSRPRPDTNKHMHTTNLTAADVAEQERQRWVARRSPKGPTARSARLRFWLLLGRVSSQRRAPSAKGRSNLT